MRRLSKSVSSHIILEQTHAETTVQTYVLNEETASQWISINGLKDQQRIQELLEELEVDPLWIEDIFYVNQRTKLETALDSMYLVVNGSSQNQLRDISRYIQIIFLKNTVITISETSTDMFYKLKSSIEEATEKHMDRDHFVYLLMDHMIDFYLETELHLAQELLELEQAFLDDENQSITELHALRKESYTLKALAQSLVDPSLQKELKQYLNIPKALTKRYDDVFDHIYRLNVLLSEDREMVRNIFDLYNNNMANRMNDIMKTLTIFSAIFIPLSFFAGVFGMNFADMPILSINHALIWFFGFSLIIALGMLGFFKYKDWL